MRLPVIHKSRSAVLIGDDPPIFSMNMITEGSAVRERLIVRPTLRVWEIIQQSGVLSSNEPYHAARVVYSWHMLKKHGLGKQFQAVIAMAKEEKLDILVVAVREIKFLNAMKGE